MPGIGKRASMSMLKHRIVFGMMAETVKG